MTRWNLSYIHRCTLYWTLYCELYYTLNLTLYLTLYCSLCSTLFCTLGCLRYFFVRNMTLLYNVQNAMYRQNYLVKRLFIKSTLCLSLSKFIISKMKHYTVIPRAWHFNWGCLFSLVFIPHPPIPQGFPTFQSVVNQGKEGNEH